MSSSSPPDLATEPPGEDGLSPAELTANFAELQSPLTRTEAFAEASRCLYCFDAPCTRACPTQIDVPGFIRRILHDDTIGAAETILEVNILGGSCARACPTEVLCEGACVDHTLLGAPVKIGRLQRMACDAASGAAGQAGISFFTAGPDSGKRVAVIGAGPAGLTCAHELRKRGHAVTVFEARAMPGGINTYGIARYKYDTDFALSEVNQVLAIGGIDLRLDAEVNGQRILELLSDNDAVFLGIGLGRTAALGIEGEDLPGVWEALDFIFQTHTRPLPQCECGRRVLVIGGGSTAVDAATAAVRLGAEQVTIAYRRTAEEMPAFAYEFELSRSDGVHWQFSAAPLRITGRAGRATGVEFVRTRPTDGGRRAKLHRITGSNFTLPADMIVKALGQEPLTDLLDSIPHLKLDRGRVVVDPGTGATSVAKLFAGGDCLSSGAELVDAIQQGKIAAAAIDAMLAGKAAAGPS
jgi:glutamate synthase (NADPH/NADH) small chain